MYNAKLLYVDEISHMEKEMYVEQNRDRWTAERIGYLEQLYNKDGNIAERRREAREQLREEVIRCVREKRG